MIIKDKQKCTSMITSGKCLPVGQGEGSTGSFNCIEDNDYFSSWEVTVWLFITLLFLLLYVGNVS